MRKFGVSVALLLSAAAVSAYGGFPTDNPDDQIRFFWGTRDVMYPSLRDAGFNNIMDDPGPLIRWDFAKGEGCEKPLDAIVEKSEKFRRDGIDWTLQFFPQRDKTLNRRYSRIDRKGKPIGKMDASTPGCLDEIRRMAEYAARRAKMLKCGIGLHPASEERIHTQPNFAAHACAAFKAETGLDIPPEVTGEIAPHWSRIRDFPADRVVAEDYPVLAYYRWFWKTGDAYQLSYKVLLDAFKKEFGDGMFSMYDPSVRLPPIWGSGGEVSHLEQFKVADPFPYQASYVISEQKAMAKGRPGQGVLMLVQGIADSYDLAPTNVVPADLPEWRRKYPRAVYITPAPDLFLEELWSAYSRQIDGIGFHGWDALWMDAAQINAWRRYYVHTNPETRKVVCRIFAELGRPLGPLLRACPEPASEVAVLESYATALFCGDAPWAWTLPCRICGYLAEGAGLQPSSLFEEEIARDGIPDSVKVILACGVDVVTRKTAAALKRFQERGGRIIADGRLAPGVKSDALLPRIPQYTSRRDAEGLEREWLSAMAALRQTVEQNISWHVKSENPRIVIRTRRYGQADYVFAINDLRGFGEYLGPWKRVKEKGLPNSGEVLVRRCAGAVYDLVRHEPVRFEVVDGVTHIPVRYSTSDGRLFLVTEKRLGKLFYKHENTVDGKTHVTVTSEDKDVMIPIAVTVGDKVRYGVVANGVWTRDVAGAGCVSVLNLADGSNGVGR